MFGSHLSIAGGLHNALIEAQKLGMDCVQVFTKNPRQWRVPPLTNDQIDQWRSGQESTGIIGTVSHDSYLINLAATDRTTRSRSIRLFGEELVRCEALGIPHLVTHPGAHMGRGEVNGLERVADALNRLHDKLPGLSVVTCLEATAGQGTSLGHRFEHLAELIHLVEADQRLGVCLDTAHLLASGYDLTSGRGTRAVLRQFDKLVGLDRVRVLHLNDSKVERGRRVDRHEHIGHGHVSIQAFEVLVNHHKFRKIPKILETPKAQASDGRPWDAVNLETLHGLLWTSPKPKRRGSRPRSGRGRTG